MHEFSGTGGRMMIQLPDELRQALGADDAEDLMALLKRRRKRDFRALQGLVSVDPVVPPHFRTKALFALGWWGDPSVVPLIREILPHLDERARISAISALGHIGSQEAVVEIAEHLGERSDQVRKAAVAALSRADTPEAREKLRQVASDDPVPWVRELAARKLT